MKMSKSYSEFLNPEPPAFCRRLLINLKGGKR